SHAVSDDAVGQTAKLKLLITRAEHPIENFVTCGKRSPVVALPLFYEQCDPDIVDPALDAASRHIPAPYLGLPSVEVTNLVSGFLPLLLSIPYQNRRRACFELLH